MDGWMNESTLQYKFNSQNYFVYLLNSELSISELSTERTHYIQSDIIILSTCFSNTGLNPFNLSDQSDKLITIIM